jgi:hypothetical protein
MLPAAQRLTRTHLYNRTGKGSRALPLKASPSRADAWHRARRAVSATSRSSGSPCSTRRVLVSSPFHRIRSEHSRVSVTACSGLALLTCGLPQPVRSRRTPRVRTIGHRQTSADQSGEIPSATNRHDTKRRRSLSSQAISNNVTIPKVPCASCAMPAPPIVRSLMLGKGCSGCDRHFSGVLLSKLIAM